MLYRMVLPLVLLAGFASGLPAAETLAVFELKGSLTEKPAAEDFPFAMSEQESLQSLVSRMDKAAADDDVVAVVILDAGVRLGFAQRDELRQAMSRIQAAGKPIYAHAESMMTGSYALLSGADRLSVTPTGYLIITGIHAELPYVRGLLDRLGVTPDFLTCGDYKSAGETFTRNSASDEAREMYNWLYDGLYSGIVDQIASGRDVERAQAEAWIDGGLYSAEKAAEEELIDAVEHRNEFVAHIQSKHGKNIKLDKAYGKKKPKTIDLNNPFAVMQFYMDLLAGPQTPKSTKDAVGIVYVEGNILSGSPEPSLFGPGEGAYSDSIRKALDQAAEDKTIKAVVLRIDSPGGSAVASEAILQASQRLGEKKPLIVSMGNIAASGGYFVACGGRQIVADPTTITGSIGVVTGKFATTKMWNNVGIHFEEYGRGKRSSLMGTSAPFTDEEKRDVQKWMDEVYEAFKKHVVEARGEKLTKPIDEIAGGRIYTGRQALELGLVDKLGDLQMSIELAAKEAGMTSYEVRPVPRPKNFMELLAADLSGQKDETPRLQLSAETSRSSLWDAALPLLKGMDPHRLEVLRRVFQQVDMIQQERAILAMPVLDVR